MGQEERRERDSERERCRRTLDLSALIPVPLLPHGFHAICGLTQRGSK